MVCFCRMDLCVRNDRVKIRDITRRFRWSIPNRRHFRERRKFGDGALYHWSWLGYIWIAIGGE
jgi:hypothetical protein